MVLCISTTRLSWMLRKCWRQAAPEAHLRPRGPVSARSESQKLLQGVSCSCVARSADLPGLSALREIPAPEIARGRWPRKSQPVVTSSVLLAGGYRRDADSCVLMSANRLSCGEMRALNLFFLDLHSAA